MTFVDDARLRELLALAVEPELVAGRFEVGALLGEGGMGTVFEAWDREGDRLVALKLLRDLDEAAHTRLAREAEALALLSHPGIVGYVAHGITPEGKGYLAMERLTGMTLAARLAGGPLSVEDVASVGIGVADALAAAHDRGLVHRDIKPSNVFLEDGDTRRIKLLDFGLARAADALAITRAGALLGTPSYMAPEQVRGPQHGAELPDSRADLFALGAVLFECSTGRPPFVGADTQSVLVKILVEQPPLVRELRPSVPPSLEALIARMLSKDVAQRPARAADVARALASLLVVDSAATDIAPSASADEMAQPGALLAGKYRVIRVLGQGGMGVVVLARHETLDRYVAIKLIRGSEAGNGPPRDGIARLVREARAASRLESEHVARVMDVGSLDDGEPFIVMEHLSGKDLGQLLRDRERLPVSMAVDFVLQASEAIAEAHAQGIIHRDLKPSNLFLTTRRDGSALIKVLDFGISKLGPSSDPTSEERFSKDASITAPDVLLGSPLYMSPEQLQSAKLVDTRTDIWSLGVVLHELLTGQPPFHAERAIAVAAKIAAGAPADLREARPDVPEALAAVVRRCLEKDPAHRFGSIAELARALAPYAEGGSLSRDGGVDPRSRSRPLRIAFSATALALLVAGAVAGSRRMLDSAAGPATANGRSTTSASPVSASPVSASPASILSMDSVSTRAPSAKALPTSAPTRVAPGPTRTERSTAPAPPSARARRVPAPRLSATANAPAGGVDAMNPMLIRR